jgi:hypothetical protein
MRGEKLRKGEREKGRKGEKKGEREKKWGKFEIIETLPGRYQ